MILNPSPTALNEQALRRKLNIPADAERVIVFAESSHWDPDWLYTSETYYQRFVQNNLDQALAALQREPRRVYSVECMFFLRMYWDRHPEYHQTLRELLNAGRLRLTSSGVTTADTLIPGAESLLRDFLVGQEWLRANGITQEPRLAYFTDSFGCSASLPSLLRAAGFDRTALTRVDGMYFMGCDFETAKNFPRPGSTAAYLQHELKTLDFIWRDANGAEVLCHWNAFNYGQGDMIAFRGVSRVYIVPLAWPARSEAFVAGRIAQFTAQLDPLRRTPYMFCPIGFDFVPPIDDLLALLDRYNRVRYPTTGVWVVNAGLDDYLALVECYRERLPVAQIDPNPYWTGFYTARPALKKRCRDLADQLVLAESLALLPARHEAPELIQRELAAAWWDAVSSNHHDFITGTSPDAVVEQEQIPWLVRAAQIAQTAIQQRVPSAQPPAAAHDRCPAWQEKAEQWTIQTPDYALELDRQTGSLVRVWHPETKAPLLEGPSNAVIAYRDSGGLWRMGHEFRGGQFKAIPQAELRPLGSQIHPEGGELCADWETGLGSEVLHRSLWFDKTSPLIHGCVAGRAPDKTTITVRIASGLRVTRLAMGEPGGVVTRPLLRFYQPTFWPAQDFVYLYDESAGRGLAVLLALPSAISCTPDGILEIIALRNANRERAFGFVNIPANPASGHECEPYAFHYALWFTGAGDWKTQHLPEQAHRFQRGLKEGQELHGAVEALVQIEPPGALLSAFKPAARGAGLIVRLIHPAAIGQVLTLSLPGRRLRQAFLCDARERDLAPLSVDQGRVSWSVTQAITTLRLIVE